jgi:hypothetical protein
MRKNAESSGFKRQGATTGANSASGYSDNSQYRGLATSTSGPTGAPKGPPKFKKTVTTTTYVAPAPLYSTPAPVYDLAYFWIINFIRFNKAILEIFAQGVEKEWITELDFAVGVEILCKLHLLVLTDQKHRNVLKPLLIEPKLLHIELKQERIPQLRIQWSIRLIIGFETINGSSLRFGKCMYNNFEILFLLIPLF